MWAFVPPGQIVLIYKYHRIDNNLSSYTFLILMGYVYFVVIMGMFNVNGISLQQAIFFIGAWCLDGSLQMYFLSYESEYVELYVIRGRVFGVSGYYKNNS